MKLSTLLSLIEDLKIEVDDNQLLDNQYVDGYLDGLTQLESYVRYTAKLKREEKAKQKQDDSIDSHAYIFYR